MKDLTEEIRCKTSRQHCSLQENQPKYLRQVPNVILQRITVIARGQQQVPLRFPGVHPALEPAIHPSPEANVLRAQIRDDRPETPLRAVQRVDVLVHVVRHVAPQRECPLRQPQIQPVLLAVPDERPVLARVHVIVQREQEALVELERGGELLHQLPRGVEELSEYRGDLLRVALDVGVALAEFVPERQPVFLYQSLNGKRKRLLCPGN